MNILSRVTHRLEPYGDESAIGFMMRLAYKNRLKSAPELLKRVLGSESPAILHQRIPDLAFFCRNTIDEFQQLSGFEKWWDAQPHWVIQGEWLTKSVFIQNQLSRACPMCLDQSPYIRALWSLSFYKYCAWHECALIDRCPKCHRALDWDRLRPEFCNCSQYLGEHSLELPEPESLLLSKVIAYRLTQNQSLIQSQSSQLVEQLAALSVDGLCKTIWFLGHCVPELGQYSTGHGRKRPNDQVFTNMLQSAFALLRNWPESLGHILDKSIHQELHPQFSAVAFHYLLRPLDHYLKSSLDSPELAFIGHVYEQYLHQIWLKSGRRNSGSKYEKQLRLEF